MNCNINDENKKLLANIIDEDIIKEDLKLIESLSEGDRAGLSFNPDSIAVRALNHKEVTYSGEKAQVIKVDIINNIPESDTVVVHLNVKGEYRKEIVTGTSRLNITKEEILELKSRSDFVFTASNNPTVLAVNALTSPELLKGLVEDISSYDREISFEEKSLLDGALNSIAKPLTETVSKMTVLLEEQAKMSGGKIDLMGDIATISLASNRNKGEMSTYEAFVHELYHGATAYILDGKDPETAGIRKSIEDLRDAFFASKEAQEVFKNNLPNKDTATEDFNSLMDYFSDPKVGLHEFLAYARTNLALYTAMSTLNTREKNEEYPNLAAKIIGIARKIINKLSDKILKRPEGNDAIQMAWLIDRLINTSLKQVKKKKDGVLGSLFKILDNYDKKVAEFVDKQQEKATKRGIKIGSSTLGIILRAPLNIIRASYDETVKKAVAAASSFNGLKLDSTIPTVLRHGMQGDSLSEKAQLWTMLNQKHDTTRENVRRQLRLVLRETFNRKMTTEDFHGLNVLLETDYASIMDKHELLDLLDIGKLNTKIANVEKQLKSKVPEKDFNYYTFESKLLAKYMVKNEDHILLLKNPTNIAMKLNSINEVNNNPDPNLVELIDELSSLYAFREVGSHAKAKLKEIVVEENGKNEFDKNGIAETMIILKGIKEEGKELFTDEGVSQSIKGYRVDVIDENTDVIVANVSEEANLKKAGYSKLFEVKKHPNDKSPPQAFYKSMLPTKNRMHKTSVRYKNTSARGSSIGENYHKEGSAASSIKAQRDIVEASNLMYKKIREVQKGIYKEAKEDKMFSPRFNEFGDVLDFNYNMDKETKRKVLGVDIDTFNIIGSTAASNFDKKISKENNKAILTELVKDNAINAPRYKGEKTIGKNAEVYVWIGPNSKDKKNKELWQVFPSEGKALFTHANIDGKKIQGFYVREDLKNNILGYREDTVTDYRPFNFLGIKSKYVMQVGEEILAALTKIYKSQILLRIPEVLFSNIISNFVSMLVYKISPAKVAKYKLNAVKELTDYIDLSKERAVLDIKIKSGKASIEDKRRIGVIDNKMNMSSIKDLVDVGFYNQIMEDLESTESGNIVKDFVGKQVEKLPTIVQNGLNWTWLPDSNPVVKFMETSTQYSDFVARYALFNILVKEKGVSKEEAIKKARNLFVNYANANSPFLEWMNKIGGVMFTKYFTNIQKAIVELGRGHPITFLMFVLGQNMVHDVSDITDSSFLTKNMYNLFYNPVEGAINSAMPGSYVMASNLLR